MMVMVMATQPAVHKIRTRLGGPSRRSFPQGDFSQVRLGQVKAGPAIHRAPRRAQADILPRSIWPPEMVRFLDPEIVENVDKSYIEFILTRSQERIRLGSNFILSLKVLVNVISGLDFCQTCPHLEINFTRILANLTLELGYKVVSFFWTQNLYWTNYFFTQFFLTQNIFET